MHVDVRTAVLLAALTLPLSGCLFRTRKVDTHIPASGVLQEATTDQLVGAINGEAAKIRSLKATAEITASVTAATKGKITDYRGISGYLLVRKPGDLRLFGLVSVVGTRLFDLASDGQRFKLSIPVQNKFITGSSSVTRPSSQPLENLRPQQIFDALLIRAIDPQTEIAALENGLYTALNPKLKKLMDEPTYVLSVIRKRATGWYLTRKITFSRRDLRPRQQLVYDNDGSVVTDVLYSNFNDTGGMVFPMDIAIRRPKEGNTIRLRLTKLAINSELSSDQFALEQPAGAKLLDLDIGSLANDSVKSAVQPPASRQKTSKPSEMGRKTSPLPPKAAPKAAKPVEPAPRQNEITSNNAAESQLPHDKSLTTGQLLSKVETDLRSITRHLTSDEQKLLEQVKLFIKESRADLAEGNAGKAHGLAVKASVLSKELLK